MFFYHHVFQSHVIGKYAPLSFHLTTILLPPCSSVTMSSRPMFFCLIQNSHGLGWGEAVPQERENQINTLVLKDINFTINIIELSYYRTIDTLNQSKKAPVHTLYVLNIKMEWHTYTFRNAPFYHITVGTDALVCPKHPNHWKRTDEGVCPYFVAFHQPILTIFR